MTERPTPELVDEPERITAVVRGTAVPTADLPAFFDRAFGTLFPTVTGQGVQPLSAAFALYRSMPTDVVDLEVGFVVDRPVTAEGEVVPSTLPGGRIARSTHAGGFDGLGGAWQHLMGWVGEQGLTPSSVFWEVYLTEPSPEMDPAELRTELDVPVS